MPMPERGTSAWLRSLALAIRERGYDLWSLANIDRDNLTLEEERHVDSLLAEIHAMSAPPAEGEKG